MPSQRHQTARTTITRTWPWLAVATILIVAIGWRSSRADPPTQAQARARAPQLTQRVWKHTSIKAPVGWQQLSRSTEYVTWGSADRAHTVTIAATEASVLPLAGVVRAVARDAAQTVPGTRLTGQPVPIDLPRAPGPKDTAALAQFRVTTPQGTVHITQVWRRDERSERDLVATWTSADGRWPVDPGTHPPEPH